MPKTILITGASRGVGYQTALELGQKGHDVIAVARSENRLRELETESTSIVARPTDLTDPDGLDRLIRFTSEEYNTLDILINNAGTLVNKPFVDLEDSDWKQMWDVNLMAPVQLIQRAISIFADSAHILNISSMGGYQGSAKFPGLTAYSVSKGGLSILTECLAAELSDQPIFCNALCLGMVQTEMLEEAFPGVEAPVSAEQMGQYVAEFALEGHTFYNGQILPVALKDPE